MPFDEESIEGYTLDSDKWLDREDRPRGEATTFRTVHGDTVVVAYSAPLKPPPLRARIRVQGKKGARWFFASSWERISPPPTVLPEKPRFDGSEYHPSVDDARLTGQLKRIFDLMADGLWRTLEEIEAVTGDPPASISAQLRHLRKKRFGSHIVDKRPRGDRVLGLWEYSLELKSQPAELSQ